MCLRQAISKPRGFRHRACFLITIFLWIMGNKLCSIISWEKKSSLLFAKVSVLVPFFSWKGLELINPPLEFAFSVYNRYTTTIYICFQTKSRSRNCIFKNKECWIGGWCGATETSVNQWEIWEVWLNFSCTQAFYFHWLEFRFRTNYTRYIKMSKAVKNQFMSIYVYM